MGKAPSNGGPQYLRFTINDDNLIDLVTSVIDGNKMRCKLHCFYELRLSYASAIVKKCFLFRILNLYCFILILFSNIDEMSVTVGPVIQERHFPASH